MGRLAHARALGLWMNGQRVGTWRLAPHAPDSLEYDPAWVRSETGRPLSLSLPFTPGNAPHRGRKVRDWFENLLPDSKAIRERIARRFNTGSTDAFALLARIGRDCVGALEILPEDESSKDTGLPQAVPLTEAQVAGILRDTTTPTVSGWAGGEDLRISIAGAQEKTALLWQDSNWHLPRGATPTTHIFKLPLGLIGGMKIDMRDSVDNEWLCAEILRAYGLPVARCAPLRFEDQKVLVVERFDRTWRSGPGGRPRLLRLPQEDMCQASGTPADAKYESDGGPGMDRIFDLLDGAITRDQDRRDFFKAQLLFWMLCATDGHGKNFSLFLRPGGRYQLTPLYDVLSAYPVLGKRSGQIAPSRVKMAMAVRSRNAHWRMQDIQRRHWEALGARQGVLTERGDPVRHLVDEIVAHTPSVISTVSATLPSVFPAPLAEAIFGGLQRAARLLGG